MTQTVRRTTPTKPNLEANMFSEAPRLRVAGVDPELGFGGGETQVLGLTLALVAGGQRRGTDLRSGGTALGARGRKPASGAILLRIRNAVDMAAAIRLRAIFKRERYDVVHFHTSRAHSMAPFARGFAQALFVTRRMDYRPNRDFRAVSVQSRRRLRSRDSGWRRRFARGGRRRSAARHGCQ